MDLGRPESSDTARSRRDILQSVTAATTGSVLVSGCLDPTDRQSADVQLLSGSEAGISDVELDLFLDGLETVLPSHVRAVALEDAELALFDVDSDVVSDRDRLVDAIDRGTTVGVVGDDATRTLVATLRETRSEQALSFDHRSSLLPDDLAYSFGYELSTTFSRGVAMVSPADDGVLELFVRYGRFEHDRDALVATLVEYRDATRASRRVNWAGSDGVWNRVGRVSTTTAACPGGTLTQTIECETHTERDGDVRWRHRDRMVSDRQSACETETSVSRNDELIRRMEYDTGIVSFDPATGAMQSTTGRNGDGDEPDLTVGAVENHTENAIKWEYDIDRDTPSSDTSVVVESTATVTASSGAVVAPTATDLECTFTADGWRDRQNVLENGCDGRWEIG